MRISVGKETKLQLILGTKVEVTSGAVITVTITIVKEKLINLILNDGKILLFVSTQIYTNFSQRQEWTKRIYC